MEPIQVRSDVNFNNKQIQKALFIDSQIPKDQTFINYGTIENTTGTITGGTVQNVELKGTIKNSGIISGGTISGTIKNNGTISGGTISGGTVQNVTLEGAITVEGSFSNAQMLNCIIGSSTDNTEQSSMYRTQIYNSTFNNGTIYNSILNYTKMQRLNITKDIFLIIEDIPDYTNKEPVKVNSEQSADYQTDRINGRKGLIYHEKNTDSSTNTNYPYKIHLYLFTPYKIMYDGDTTNLTITTTSNTTHIFKPTNNYTETLLDNGIKRIDYTWYISTSAAIETAKLNGPWHHYKGDHNLQNLTQIDQLQLLKLLSTIYD